MKIENNENNPFERIFGNTCELRLLEFLLPLRGMFFNMSDFESEMGVSTCTITQIVNKFVEYDILISHYTRDKMTLYKINPESEIVQNITILNNILTVDFLNNLENGD